MKNSKLVLIVKASALFLILSSSLSAQNIVSKVYKGEIEEVRTMLSKGVDPNTKQGKETILAIALENKQPEIAKLLIETKGIRINEWNIRSQPERSWKYQHLMNAVAFPELVRLLIDKGAMIDSQDDWILWDGKLHESGGNTALMLAIGFPKFTYTESAKILIEKGAKIDIQNKLGYTALMLSVHNTEVAKILIDKGAKIDITTKHGETALMLAAGKYTEVVKLLLDKGANIAIRQSTYQVSPNALDYAAKEGNIDAAKLILEKAKTLGIKEKVICSALHWAVISNKTEMAKYLLDEGANIEGADDLGGYTPLMETSMLEMVQILVSRGANVNAKNKFSFTPLHKAVQNFNNPDIKEKDAEKIMALLLDKGANVDAQDGNGATPLMYAATKVTPVKLLLNRNPNINLQNKNGESALMYAVKGGLIKASMLFPVVGSSVDVVKMLINKGADVNSKDKWGKTPLMHAAGGVNAIGSKYSSYIEVAEILLQKGANLEDQDKDGHTALYWAQRFDRPKTADLLIAKGANPTKKYVRSADKSNVAAGIVGKWDKSMVINGVTYTTRVVMNADWSYSKAMRAGKGEWIPDGGGYTTYDLRDGRIWLFNGISPAVVEFRLEGKDLVLNGEKFSKSIAK